MCVNEAQIFRTGSKLHLHPPKRPLLATTPPPFTHLPHLRLSSLQPLEVRGELREMLTNLSYQ